MSVSAPTYPDKQPFPRIVAVSMEGKADADMFTALEGLPTLELAAFVEARRALSNYLHDYDADEQAKGLAVGIRGAHGAGKTHLIRFLIQSIPHATPPVEPGGADGNEPTAAAGDLPLATAPPVLVYVKVSTVSDYLALHRQIVSLIGQEALLNVNTRWLSRVVQQEASKSKITQAAVATLQQNPNAVFEYLNAGLISSRAVIDAHSDAVSGMAHSQDFIRIASYFFRPELRGEAFTWFMGVPQNETTLRKLGIARSLDAEMAREALHFLIAVFGLARQPLVVFIDQIERLLRHPIAETKAANIGMLYSLAEWFAEERGFLGLAGATDAWEQLPPDFFGRLHRQFVLPGLSPRNCLDLTKVYLHPLDTFQPFAYPAELFPFDEQAVRQMATISQGNPRRFLRLAFRSFELAQPTQALIDAAGVDRAYDSVEEDFDRTSVLFEIEARLREAGLTYVETPRILDDAQPDLAVLRDGKYVAFVDVSDAIFARDEAERALRYARVAPTLKRAYPQAQYILVVAGYASPQVQEGLRGLVDRYFSYAPGVFASDFTRLLQTLLPVRPETAPASAALDPEQTTKIDLLVSQYADLQRTLVRVLEDRDREGQARTTQLQDFSSYQQTQVAERIRDEASEVRASLRRAETVRLNKAREDRELREHEQRQVACADGERQRTSEFRQSILVGLAWIALGILLFLGVSLVGPLLAPGANALAVELAAVGLLLACFVYAATIVAPALRAYQLQDADVVRASRSPALDLARLDQAALRLSRERSANPWRLLTDPNPQVRYLAARALAYRPELSWGPYPTTYVSVSPDLPNDQFEGRLWEALSHEVQLDVQRAILLALVEYGLQANRGETVAGVLTRFMTNATDRETLYVLDALDRLSRGPNFNEVELIKRPAAVAIYGVITRLLSPLMTDRWLGAHPDDAESAAVVFASVLTFGVGPDSAGWRLAQAFKSQRETGLPVDSALIGSFGLASARPQLIDRMMEIYGLSDEHSLGYYPDLRKSELPAEIYEFLFQVRLALAEVQHNLRAGATPLET